MFKLEIHHLGIHLKSKQQRSFVGNWKETGKKLGYKYTELLLKSNVLNSTNYCTNPKEAIFTPASKTAMTSKKYTKS